MNIRTIFYCILFFPMLGYAFGVDVCFKYNSSNKVSASLIRNCIDVPRACKTDHLTEKALASCQKKALTNSAMGLLRFASIIGGRSLVHSDATYLMAQLIGFTPWQAYQIMMYSEATDQSRYTPFSQTGLPLLTEDEIRYCRAHWGSAMPTHCLLTTPTLTGISKFNLTSGGSLLHLQARYSPDGHPPPPLTYPINYLTEDTLHEPLLLNFRSWVFAQRPDACVGGITLQHMHPQSGCEHSNHALIVRLNQLLFPGQSSITLPMFIRLGLLPLQKTPKLVLANHRDLNHYLTPHDVSLAKLGIFIHALEDRYSHHLCSDNSYFYRNQHGDYETKLAKKECSQQQHFLRHAWEQGALQNHHNLAPENQTMKPALDAAYDQLLAFAELKGIEINPRINKSAVINHIIRVLEIYDAQERMDQMVKLMEDYQALPLPGHGRVKKLSIDEWLHLGTCTFPGRYIK